MSQKIMVGNLPPDVSVEELNAILVEAGVEDPEVTLNNEGNEDRVVAILTLGDIDRPTADQLAESISGRQFRGRTLNAYVPLFT